MAEPQDTAHTPDDEQEEYFSPVEEGSESEDSGSDVEAEFDHEDLGPLPSDHPLLANLQAQLRDQLSEEKHRIDLNLHQMVAQRKEAERRKDETGLLLYGQQQHFAGLQKELNDLNEGVEYMTGARAQMNAAALDERKIHAEAEDEVRALRDNYDKNKAELDKLLRTLAQIEEYNTAVRDEIALTRRAAYKGEEDVVKLEKEKGRLDRLLTTLAEQEKDIREQIGLLTAQLQAQEQETELARQTLAEGRKEMEGVEFERRQLLSQLDEAVSGLQRRDLVEQKVREDVRKAAEVRDQLDAELRMVQKRVIDEVDSRAGLESVLHRVKAEIPALAHNLKLAEEDATAAQAEAGELEAALMKVNTALVDDLRLKTNALERERDRLDRAYQKVHESVIELRRTLGEQEIFKETLAKNQTHATADIQAVVQSRAERQQHLISLENMHATAKLQAVKEQADLQKLDEEQRTLEGLLTVRQKQLEEREGMMGRFLDEISKKQGVADLLNRRLNEVLGRRKEENTGPLEAEIANLSRALAAAERECAETESAWVKHQRASVEGSRQLSELRARISQKDQARMVAESRRVRFGGAETKGHRRHKVLEDEKKAIHTDIERLNRMISVNDSEQVRLAQENFNLETSFGNRLLELEQECAQIEEKLEATRKEKQSITEDLVEAERQALLWERKITLERETQAAANPEHGKGELDLMRKEIHRMKLRLRALDGKQTELIKKMELQVHKRGQFVRSQAGKKVGDKAMRATRQRNKLESLENAVAIAEDDHHHLSAHASALHHEVSATTSAVDGLRQDEEDHLRKVAEMAGLRQFNVLALAQAHELGRRLGQVAGKEPKQPDRGQRMLDREKRVRRVLGDIVGELTEGLDTTKLQNMIRLL